MRSLRDILQIGAAAVGIDIGKSAIKVAEVRRTARGTELRRFGVALTPPGSVEGGLILDQQAVARTVGEVLRHAGVRTRRAVVSVTGQNVLARVLRLPPIPPEEVKQAIRWEAERHLPFPVDEAVIDVQTVREVSENGVRQLEVLLAAAPEALVLTHIRTLEGAQLIVDAVEVGALAMARGLGQTEGAGTHVLVNLGASTTDVAVVHNGVPQFTRTILLGGDALTRAITQVLKTDAASAEEAKIRYGLGWEEWPPHLAEGVFATEVSQALAELITQVRRSLDFFRAQFAGVVISDMILCGGGSGLRHLDHHLSSELELPVTIANPLAVVRPRSHQEKAAQAVAPQLTVATGLALRTVA
jgi:type IV pilus assembly protein PilM